MVKYFVLCVVVCVFWISFAIASSLDLGMIQMIIDRAQKTVVNAPSFPEKQDMLRELNNMRKIFLKPAEGR